MNRIFTVLKDIPIEILRVLARLLSYFYLLLIYLLRLLKRLFRKKPSKNDRKVKCVEVPAHIKRKPDPCLYSQQFIRERYPGTPVTWDNPDIWITDLNGTPVNSRELQTDRDYQVHCRIHNASFDPAIGTGVRCYFRPFGFSSTSVQAVEVNPDNSEKIIVVHIPAWGNRIAVFNWRTPSQAGHYCLKAECRHPEDKEPGNNIGQENTDVLQAQAGETISTLAWIANTNQTEGMEAHFTADAFNIPDEEIEFQLATQVKSLGDAGFFPKFQEKTQRFRYGRRPAPVYTAYKYTGQSGLMRKIQSLDSSLPESWNVTIQGAALNQRISLSPEEERELLIEVQTPGNIPKGQTHQINLTAFDNNERVIGGITLFIEII